jgi:Holliday junction resolvasome RuvABC endonuclease subunit
MATATSAILGVDPGGRDTGLVVRSGRALLAHDVVTRRGGKALDVDPTYLNEVNERIERYLDEFPVIAIAVEGLKAPGQFMQGKVRITDPSGIMATAVTFGAVLVPPGGNGSQYAASYPSAIRAPGKGFDRNRHARSAWDIAGAGVPLLRRLQRTLVA